MVQKKQKKHRNQNKKTSRFKIPPLLKNVLVCLFVVGFFYLLSEKNKGYNWTTHSLIINNLASMKKYKELTMPERQKAKFGLTGALMDHINKNTPKDAIILMPPDSILKKGEGKKKMNQYINRVGWANYFVYPRKLVFERDKEKYQSLYDSAQYIAIINGWGYHKLDYKLRNKPQHTVLPLKYATLQKQQEAKQNN